MPSLHVLESYDSKKSKDEPKVRLEYFETYADATAEAIKWAGSKSCRCFGIDEKLAKKIYKGVEHAPLKKITAVKKTK